MNTILGLLERLYGLRDRTSFFKDDTLNIVLMVRALWRGRLGIVLTTIGAMAGVFLLSYQITPLYPSRSTVYLVSEDEGAGGLPAGIGAMASVLGYGLPGSSNQPLALDELLGSRRLFENLAQTPVSRPTGSADEMPLHEVWYPTKEKPTAFSVEKTIRRLRKFIRIQSSLESNLINIEVLADSPALARQLNLQLIDMADTYYREIRSEELSTKNSFLEKQTEKFHGQLNKAEDQLTDFLSKNAQYEQSPALLQEYARLLRNIELQQKIYLELQAQYFSTSLELSGKPRHVRLLNEPTTPLKTSYPDRFKLVLLAMVGMVLLNILFIIVANELRVDRDSASSSEA